MKYCHYLLISGNNKSVKPFRDRTLFYAITVFQIIPGKRNAVIMYQFFSAGWNNGISNYPECICPFTVQHPFSSTV